MYLSWNYLRIIGNETEYTYRTLVMKVTELEKVCFPTESKSCF